MSAPRAHLIRLIPGETTKVETARPCPKNSNHAACTPSVCHHGVPEVRWTVSNVSDLIKPDLVRLANLVWPEGNGRRFFGPSAPPLSTIRKAIIDGAADPTGTGQAAAAPATASKGKPGKSPTPPTPATPGSIDAIIDARIDERIGTTPPVDADAVRDIVKEAVENISATLPPRKVEIAGKVRDLPVVHHPVLPDLLDVLANGWNARLIGPAGSGKTTLARQAAEILGLPFHTLSLGPQTPESRITGYTDLQGNFSDPAPYRWAKDGGLMLWDEADAAHPGIILASNPIMDARAGQEVEFSNGPLNVSDAPRVAVGCFNTLGWGATRQYPGRAAQDFAALSRYHFTFIVGYDEASESALALSFATTDEKRNAVEDYLKTFRGYRKAILDNVLDRPLACPRTAISGSSMVCAGWSAEKALEHGLLAGLEDDARVAIGAPRAAR